MNSDKSTYMRSFNNYFFDFLDDIEKIFPEKKEIKTAKIGFNTIKQSNPSLLIKVWWLNIYSPYRAEIDNENLEFFFNKDYSSDITSPNNKEILQFIDQIRDPIRNMDDTNKKHSLDYIKILCRLSLMYNSF
jgi:hypothetical protein